MEVAYQPMERLRLKGYRLNANKDGYFDPDGVEYKYDDGGGFETELLDALMGFYDDDEDVEYHGEGESQVDYVPQ